MKSNLIEINNVNDVKITRINDYSIHFRVGENTYFIKDSSDMYESAMTVYTKTMNGKENKWDLLQGRNWSLNIDDYIIYKHNKKTKSSVDMQFFVKKLFFDGFATGIYTQEVAKIKQIENRIDDTIQEYKKLILDLKHIKHKTKETFMLEVKI